jgi:hypothetical protein
MNPSMPFCSIIRSHSDTGALNTLLVKPSHLAQSGDMSVTLTIEFSFSEVFGLTMWCRFFRPISQLRL